MLEFGIALNVAAGVGARAFSWIDDWLGSKRTVLISLAGLIASGVVLLSARSETVFWAGGLVLGVFVGPVQAASRSYMARAAPEHLRTQMFGLFALSGKATVFLGPMLVEWITLLADNQRWGMSVVVIFFAVGAAVMLTVPAQVDSEGTDG